MRQKLFSSYWSDIFSDENIEFTREYLKAELEEEEVSDEKVEKRLYEDNELDFEYIGEVLSELFKNKNKLLVKGVESTWSGRGEGGKIIDEWSELLDIFSHCECIKIENEKGHLYVTGSHHDGGLEIEVKELTKKGEEYLDKHEYDMSDRELHNKLWSSSNYTRLFRFEW